MLQSQDHKAISYRTRFIALLSATALVAPSFAQSLPTGGTVSAGNAVIGGETNGAITINQDSTNAVINWQSFNIGVGNTVNFIQPDPASAILNRVTGSITTSIAGQLNANGQVYLINPNGIAITATGTVNTGAFVASTLGISDDTFMTGGRTFSGNGASAPVTNAGTITIERGGYLALIGGSVANSGTITVPMGRAALGSGEQATLDLSGDGFLQVVIPTDGKGSDALVSNSGTISANGGMVQLSAAAARDAARQAVNMSGTIEAQGVSGRSGDITLFGGESKIIVTGQMVVANTEGEGGSVTLASREIELATALIDASGTTGGGTIHIGGERQGGGALPHAQTLSVNAGTTINADATINGNGGDVVLWSDSLTHFAGTISAKGGALSGNGGEVEVSGKARLAYTGFTDLSAADGAFGTLLLDPYNVIISSGADTGGFTASGDDSVIDAGTLQTALAAANVTVTTGSSGTQAGDITISSALTWSSNSLLTLTAAGSIAINAPIIVEGGGQVAFNFSTANTLTGGLAFAPGSALTFTDGAQQGAQTLTVNGQTYTLLRSLSDVETLTGQNFGAGYFALAHDLDASGRTYSDALIGNTVSDTFYGTLEGLGHIISNLTIVSSGGPTGLIGRLGRFGPAGNGMDGVVRNIGLVGGSVTGAIGFGGFEGTGGLVGANNGGTIINAYNTGTVSGEAKVGGLVGVNTEGRIISSYATGAVSAVAGPNAHDYIGGLVGQNVGDASGSIVSVANSYATGTVSGGSYVGGLIGASGSPGSFNAGSRVTDVYATGAVHGTGNYVGGLAGFHYGSLTNAYATGAVSGVDYVGGVVGRYDGNGSFSADFQYATGAVSGRNFVGGLIGYNIGGLRGSYATGAVNGTGDNVGGLIGTNEAYLETVHATGAVSSTGNSVGGLVGDNLRGILTGAYATGDVSGTDNVGGLVGLNGGQVINAYAAGAVTGANNVGGLVGSGWFQGFDGRVTNAYATGAVSGNTNTGGLVGFAQTSNATTNSYWNVESSGQSASFGGTGLTTAQIRNPFTFIDGGWDFAAVWATPRAGGAPVLRSMTTAPLYDNYVRLSGDTATTYGDTISTSGITLGGIGAGNVSIGWGSAISAGTNAGTYAYGANTVLALTYSAGVASDYYVDYGAGALTVGQRALTVTASDLSRAYGDANPVLAYTVTGAGLVNGDTLSGALETTATMTSNVGVYGITQGSLANGNYAITYTGANLTVGQRAVTVTADAQSRSYGDANALTYTVGGAGLVNSDMLSGALVTAATLTSDVGVYGVTQGTLAASSNYTLSFTDGVLTVPPRTITVTADALSRVYGDANPTLTYTVGGLGLVNGDTLSGVLATAATQTSDVGAYTITQGSLAASGNYAMSYVGANLTIVPRNIAIGALGVTADNVTRAYGDANPALTWTLTNGSLVNGDTLTGQLATTATQFSGVGSYAITQGTLAAPSNYTLSFTDGVLTVAPRTITVTVDALSRVYGDANSALTYSVGGLGLVNGDTLSGVLATAATQTSDVGAYTITQGSLAASGNYAMTYVGANLTVEKRAVTVSANDVSRRYGAANPMLTYTLGGAGLINGDTLIGDLATVAGDQSEPGAYAITQGSLLASSNYSLSFREGVLTVEMAANPGPGTMASTNATAYGQGQGAFLPFYPVFTQTSVGSDGSRVLLADPRFGGTIVCLDNGAGCTTVSAAPQH